MELVIIKLYFRLESTIIKLITFLLLAISRILKLLELGFI